MTHPLEQWLRNERLAGHRATRRKLAKEVGCSPSRITQIAYGDTPSLALAAKLSEKTGIPINDFVRAD
jgi:transcriptional regulator with XRE-family HTH domain